MVAKTFLKALIILTLGGCGTTKSDLVKLSPSKLQAREIEANAGSASAAYDVAHHYTFGAYDEELSDKWSRRAVELGDLRTCGGISELRGPLPKACEPR